MRRCRLSYGGVVSYVGGLALQAGFTAVAAGPLVRSSYHAAAMAGHEGK